MLAVKGGWGGVGRKAKLGITAQTPRRVAHGGQQGWVCKPKQGMEKFLGSKAWACPPPQYSR